VDADVSKLADLERLIATTVKAFGRLDIMVNNAGIETRTTILETTEQQYEKVLQVNVKSPFFGTQLAAALLNHPFGRASVCRPWRGSTGYCRAWANLSCTEVMLMMCPHSGPDFGLNG